MNEIKKAIKEYASSIGITSCGITHYDGKSAIVCLFPYYRGKEEGNLSLYARGIDYHIIVKEKLENICDFLKKSFPDLTCDTFADIGPAVERQLAYSAGLGFFGKNRMLINDDLGSFFFIGYILCDIDIEDDNSLEKTCLNCNKCINACPGKALGECFDIASCASHISQKKGDLTDSEVAILKKSGLIFGCDICQMVCPHNNITPRPMKEFTSDLIHSLNIEDIENLSNKEFMRKYRDRAFSWRGRNVLLRNITLIG